MSAALAITTNAPGKTRRDFAASVFWSLHPLCLSCEEKHGPFSLRQLIVFAESLPLDEYARLADT